jgi:hypothetical protein
MTMHTCCAVGNTSRGMRIGEILLADGLVSAEDLERTLLNQSRRGQDRVMSMLVAEGVIDLDTAARALSKQHGVPAVLQKHFAARDPGLAALLSNELAFEHLAMPIARTRDGGLVVCLCDPTRARVIAALQQATGMTIVAAVACSRALMRIIHEVYSDDDDDAFDVSLSTGPVDVPAELRNTPQVSDPERFTLALLDDAGVDRDLSSHRMIAGRAASASELMQSIHAKNSTGPSPFVSSPSIVVPVAAIPNPSLPPPLQTSATFLSRATTRDAVTDACFELVAGHWHSGILFTVKEGMALGQRGCGGNANPSAVESLAFPLSAPSVLKNVAESRKAEVLQGGGIVNDRLEKILATDATAVAPVVVAGRLIGLLAVGGPRSSATLSDITVLAAALGDNYARIIRSAKG